MTEKKPIFRNLDADDPDPETTSIESLCVNCFKNGNTRVLLTKIPFYKEVVLMSFHCDHCGYDNNEIQSASEIQRKGIRINMKVQNLKDLNRRVIKSDHSLVRIPEVDLEIPSQSQKGEITTIEGIIERTINGLKQEQDKRREEHPEIAIQIDAFIEKLNNLKLANEPFTLFLEDISGNAHIENLNAPQVDPNVTIQYFERSQNDNHLLGIYSSEESQAAANGDGKGTDSLLKPISEDSWPLEELHGEVLQFPTLCHKCKSPCQTNMKLTSIPHFKEVVIMATVCDVCGYKTNEVKSGGGIEKQGIQFCVSIKDKIDLNRDVLKSETCSLKIPQLNCEVGSAALNGRFTTIEGLLTTMKDQMIESAAMFFDSKDEESKIKFENFIAKLQEIIDLEREAELILDDPAGNSYIQSLCDNVDEDKSLKITKYERTFDQNEELGLNDMKTENYQ